MIKIKNANIITLDENRPFIKNANLIIEGNKIKKIDTKDLGDEGLEYEVLDAKGKLLMPSFINTHMHIYSSFGRGMPSNNKISNNFIDILENVWWRLDKKLTLEAVKYSAFNTYLECIKNGVTMIFDHHASPYNISGSLSKIANMSKLMGVRSCLCYEVSNRDGKDIALEGIKENINFMNECDNNQNLIKGMFGLHASFTLDDELLNECAKAMQGRTEGYHVHVAEGIEDLKHSIKNYNKTVVERLNDFDIFKKNTLAVHCIHTNEKDLEILKSKGTNVIHNPQSNMGNAVGYSKVIDIINKGIKVGLGTDGYTADMLESMKVSNIISKHEYKNSNIGFNETLDMALKNNKFIASKYFDEDFGIIKENALADLIILDYKGTTEILDNNLGSHILFGLNGGIVDTTICNGEILMKEKKLINIDEELYSKKSKEISKQIWSKL